MVAKIEQVRQNDPLTTPDAARPDLEFAGRSDGMKPLQQALPDAARSPANTTQMDLWLVYNVVRWAG